MCDLLTGGQILEETGLVNDPPRALGSQSHGKCIGESPTEPSPAAALWFFETAAGGDMAAFLHSTSSRLNRPVPSTSAGVGERSFQVDGVDGGPEDAVVTWLHGTRVYGVSVVADNQGIANQPADRQAAVQLARIVDQGLG